MFIIGGLYEKGTYIIRVVSYRGCLIRNFCFRGVNFQGVYYMGFYYKGCILLEGSFKGCVFYLGCPLLGRLL